MESSEMMVAREKLGCCISSKGVYFTIFAKQAYAMVLEIYQSAHQMTPIMKHIVKRTPGSDYFKVCLPNVTVGMYYVWRIMHQDYSYSPAIMDPYAKGVLYFQGEWRNLVMGHQYYKSSKPQIPWKETIIYELHVGHFRKLMRAFLKKSAELLRD